LEYTLNEKQILDIEEIFQHDLIDPGVHSIILIDGAGNIIAEKHEGKKKMDFQYLAVLAAGNFGAVASLAKVVGEDEFSLLFHKGEKMNLHFSKVLSDFILINIFGRGTSLGFIRLKVAEVIEKVEKILEP
jgi:predicted regulator of Ras-like GTPase activity (Roadblock/LC7/MglB family)